MMKMMFILMQNVGLFKIQFFFVFNLISKLIFEFISLKDTQTNEQLVKLRSDMRTLKSSFNELQLRVQVMDYNRFETLFTYEIDDVKKFEDFGRIKSPSFYCAGISWNLSFHLKLVNNVPKYLSIYLNSDNVEKFIWKINTDFVIKLINQTSKKQDKVKQFNNKVFQLNDFGHGDSEFISLTKLKKKGFIKDNSIKFKILLKVGKTL